MWSFLLGQSFFFEIFQSKKCYPFLICRGLCHIPLSFFRLIYRVGDITLSINSEASHDAFSPEIYSESTSVLRFVLRSHAVQLLILLREYNGTYTKIRGFWASALCHWASNCRLIERQHCFLNFGNTHPATHRHIRELA